MKKEPLKPLRLVDRLTGIGWFCPVSPRSKLINLGVRMTDAAADAVCGCAGFITQRFGEELTVYLTHSFQNKIVLSKLTQTLHQ